jgi:hypothetical protein
MWEEKRSSPQTLNGVIMLSIKANRTFVFQLHSFHFWDGGVAKALFWY